MNRHAVVGEHFDFAMNVIDKSERTGKRYAVFVINGKPKATNVHTGIYREGIQKNIDKLAGVYDGNAKPEWIEEDISATIGWWAK